MHVWKDSPKSKVLIKSSNALKKVISKLYCFGFSTATDSISKIRSQKVSFILVLAFLSAAMR